MPQIIVRADRREHQHEGALTLLERVTVSDFESEHFAAQLVERLGWAVGDATEVEERHAAAETERRAYDHDPRHDDDTDEDSADQRELEPARAG